MQPYTATQFPGVPCFPVLFNGEPLGLASALAAEAAKILEARRAVPVHYDSWAHSTEGRDQLIAAFATAGLGERLELGDTDCPTLDGGCAFHAVDATRARWPRAGSLPG
ncbi:hypothetical protein ACFWNQ_11540 [Streptomyces virginiae]|uniref:hypothetical protein n=1 Tax=Streptomyces virginiae TaxID=1961 RepID=UPI0036539D02